ncbi:phosphonate C-P lyase system protein PhnH [Magnetovibrio sp.]|uniref:phosphonate C-P lyase system protein PhnH n=1 Tax=Magnetovibrio sp. TaxID=2024836 RepID=UPI002F944835
MTMQAVPVAPMAGFDDPVHGSQRVFRALLDAMSHPGKIITIDDVEAAPHPLNTATAAICLSLVDFETPIWADADIASSGEAMNYLRFHCGCPVTQDPSTARTALFSDVGAVKGFNRFNPGTDERPDLSTTLIVQVDGLSNADGMTLSGPGIKGTRALSVSGVTDEFWQAVRANNRMFPRGIDLILTAGAEVVCLPRTTKVEG